MSYGPAYGQFLLILCVLEKNLCSEVWGYNVLYILNTSFRSICFYTTPFILVASALKALPHTVSWPPTSLLSGLCLQILFLDFPSWRYPQIGFISHLLYPELFSLKHLSLPDILCIYLFAYYLPNCSINTLRQELFLACLLFCP